MNYTILKNLYLDDSNFKQSYSGWVDPLQLLLFHFFGVAFYYVKSMTDQVLFSQSPPNSPFENINFLIVLLCSVTKYTFYDFRGRNSWFHDN